MIMTVLERIESLRTRNQINVRAINKDLYNLVCTEEVLILSYNQISKVLKNIFYEKQSNYWNNHIDTYIIDELINDLREFKWNQTTLNPNKTTSTLVHYSTLKPFKEHIIKEGVYLILEALYEPVLAQYTNSFKKSDSPHASIKKIINEWENSRWVISGSISNNWQNITYPLLTKILQKKIKDEIFLALIWHLLQLELKNTKIVRSPNLILKTNNKLLTLINNIYLNELDIVLEELRVKTTISKTDFNYNSVQWKKNDLPLNVVKNPFKKNFFSGLNVRVRKETQFLRSQKNWILMLKGDVHAEESIKQVLKLFLHNKLIISYNLMKSHYVKNEPIIFLDYLLKRGSLVNKRPETYRVKHKKQGHLEILIPTLSLITKLTTWKFCTKIGKGTSKNAWVSYPSEFIIQNYNHVLIAFYQYYFPATNYYKSLKRLYNILKISCAHTLAKKHRSTIASQRRLVNQLQIPRKFKTRGKENKFRPEIKSIEANFKSFYTNTPGDIRSLCYICSSNKDIEIHYNQLINIKERILTSTQDIESKITVKKQKKQINICKRCQSNTL